MQIRIQEDQVEISGYVNAIERASRPLMSRMGRFIERICKGAFKRALGRNDNVRLLLNHDRDIGGTKEGTLELEEDNIGLHARAIVKDPEVVQKARNGDLVGWSFGFRDRDVEQKRDEDGLPLREVKDLDLEEVSILDRTKKPAYEGTLVSVRAEGDSIYYGEALLQEPGEEKQEPKEEREKETPEEVETKPNIDYGEFDQLIRELKDESESLEDVVDDEIDKKLNKLELELDGWDLIEERYASKYYDPQKAHEYYEKHKQLKGKTSTSSLNDEGKKAAKYVKQKLTEEKKAAIEKHKEEINKKIAALRDKYKELPLADRKALKAEVAQAIKSLRDEHKAEKAKIKADYDKKYNEELDKIKGDSSMSKDGGGSHETISDLLKKAGLFTMK